MAQLTLSDWGVILSILLSITSISILLYKDFIQGPILRTVLNSIVFLKIDEHSKLEILFQIILDDMLSGRPSDQAKSIISAKVEIQAAVAQRNRDLAHIALLNYTQELASNQQKFIIYDASPESICKYYGNKRFTFSIYAPINITNVGRKAGDVTTIVLQLTSTSDVTQKWVFSCFTEIKSEDLMDFNQFKKPIGEFIGKLFPGISIGPISNQRLDLFLVPIENNKDRIISRLGLVPGNYKARIYGFDYKNNKCLESNEADVKISSDLLIGLFNGGNVVLNLQMDDHIQTLLG